MFGWATVRGRSGKHTRAVEGQAQIASGVRERGVARDGQYSFSSFFACQGQRAPFVARDLRKLIRKLSYTHGLQYLRIR